MLIGEPTLDLGPPVWKDQPNEHHKNFINGFLTLFSVICIENIESNMNGGGNNTEYCIINHICENPYEVQFMKILTAVGQDYLSNIDTIFKKEDEDDYSDEDQDLRYIPVAFATVYLFY